MVRSLVDYRTAAVDDLAAETERAHAIGALVIWDLSHAAGVLPVHLGRAGAQLAVGCTYTFLNGGPGAPGYSYVAAELNERIDQPIRGWWSQTAMFEMAPEYRPRPDIGRLMIGSPGIIGLTAARAGIGLTAEAGIDAALAAHHRVLADFREPDLIRLGCSPLTTRHRDVLAGCAAIAAQISA